MHTRPVVLGLLAIQTWTPTACQRHGMSSGTEFVAFASCAFSNYLRANFGYVVAGFPGKYAVHSLKSQYCNNLCIDLACSLL